MKKNFTLAIALAAFVFFLAVFLGVGPAHADEPPPYMIDPGGGGDDPPHTIEGGVYYMRSVDPPVPGVSVRLVMTGWDMLTYTDTTGHFVFSSDYIQPNTGYVITVNGNKESLGEVADNSQWGQWAGWVYTDDYGYGSRMIEISPSALVSVPTAALFSNTQYAKLSFGLETGFNHKLSFKATLPGVDIGYIRSTNIEVTREFIYDPLMKVYIGRPHYAATYYSDGYLSRWGIVSTGIAAAVINTDWQSYETHEYVDPTGLREGDPTFVDFQVLNGETKVVSYKEAGSYTWSASTGIGFGIQYSAFRVSISLDVEVSTVIDTETWVKYEIHNDTGRTLYFRAYTPGGVLDPELETGGMELHVWEKYW